MSGMKFDRRDLVNFRASLFGYGLREVAEAASRVVSRQVAGSLWNCYQVLM